MRILFVQRRFHTNQYFPVKTLIENGHYIKYVTTRDSVDGRGIITPETIEMSILSKLLAKFSNVNKEKYMWKFGIPSIVSYIKTIRSFDPDVIIVKRLKAVSIITILIGRLLGIKVIVRDQVPAYGRQRFLRAMFRKLHALVFGSPLIEYTPVEGDHLYEPVPNTYYVPFIMDVDFDIEEKSYLEQGEFNILSIGSLGKRRKGHHLLLKAAAEIKSNFDINITILGDIPDDEDPYFREILNLISTYDLQNTVNLKQKVDYEEMSRVYSEHDIYVLPSFDEPAAVSHLEAMAYGLPAICSDTNGTKYYIDEGETGYIFESENCDDLADKLENILRDKERLVEMGHNSYTNVQSNHNPKIYNSKLLNVINSQ